MSVGDRSVDGQPAGSFTWRHEAGESFVDVATPDLETHTPVPAGGAIAVEGDAELIRAWVDSCCWESLPPPHLHELDLVSGTAALPEEGDVSQYVLEFRAEWPQGTVTYLWPIEVVPPEQSATVRPEPSGTADVAVVLTEPTSEGTWPRADVTVQGSTFVAGPHDMAGWGQEQAFDPDADRPLGLLPPGATLEVLGDPSRVFVTVRQIFDDGSSPMPQNLDLEDGDRTNVLFGHTTLPSEPGSYRLVLSAAWGEAGEAVFAFTFDVADEVPPGEVPPDEAPPDEGGTPEVTREMLVGSSWQLSVLGDRSAPFGDVGPVTIRFDDVHLGINGACNSFGGRWEVENGRLETRELVGTLIGCNGLTDQIDDELLGILTASPVLSEGVDELRFTTTAGDVAVFTRIGGEEVS